MFHFTDVRNAVSILKEGALFSRSEAQRRELMTVDNASADVIGITDDTWKDYVRLYFRPQTPTQYRNEGMRPLGDIQLNAHCPVPVYFLFDAVAVLSRHDSRFTDGNLAVSPTVFQDVADLNRLHFRKIYHVGPFSQEQRSEIVFHRNAEVLVPTQMTLGALRYVVCRSQAEYETLMHLLPTSIARRWGQFIGFGNRFNLFYKYWVYVDSVEMEESRVVFHFNRYPQHVGPFHAKAFLTDINGGKTFSWENESLSAKGPRVLALSTVGPLSDYSIRLSLDDNIAYANRFQEDPLPW